MASSQATQLAVLSAVSVGMWSASKDQGMWFLIVPRRQLFVFIVEDVSLTDAQRRGFGKRRRFAPSTSSLLRQLGAHSPFSSAIHKEGGCAFAFEVSFDNISGLDYKNDLIRPGRLVLEAHNTRKREFENIDSAFAYYGGADGEATRASLETLFGDSSPYKEQQRNSNITWDEALAATAGAGAGGGGGVNIAPLNGPNTHPINSGTSPINPGLPAPPLRRTKTNLLARLSSAVGAATSKSGGGKAANKNENSATNVSTSFPAVSTTTSVITTITASVSNITIGNIIAADNGNYNKNGIDDENEAEVTSAAPVIINSSFSANTNQSQISFTQGTALTSKAHQLTIDTTTRSPNPQFLFSNPVGNRAAAAASASSSPNATAAVKDLAVAGEQTQTRGLFRISQSTGDLLTRPSPLPATGTPLSSSPQINKCSSTPAPAASNIYDFRLITVHWTDPQLPEILRPIIETNEGMLRLYESGLPTWATFFPRAGLYYRPWLRSLTWVLFYAFSFFSLAVGFYDLYKTLPGLQAVLSKMVAGMWLPPVAVLQWIEEHAQIRLSILLTYIFGKSEMFLYVVRMLGHAKRTFLETTGPVVATLGPPLNALWSTSITPLAALFRTCSDFIFTVLVPPLQALSTALTLPITWLMTMLRHVASAAGGGGSAVAATSPWLVRAIPTDTINTLRNSLAIPTRAANSVWRSMNQMFAAFARHRLTWSRRALRWRVSMKKRLIGTFWLLIDAVKVCCTWIWAILNLIVAAGKAGVVRQRQEDAEKKKLEAERASPVVAALAAVDVGNVVHSKKDD